MELCASYVKDIVASVFMFSSSLITLNKKFQNLLKVKLQQQMGVSLNGGTPNLHPKCWSFLVGKTMGLLRKPTILGNPQINQ